MRTVLAIYGYMVYGLIGLLILSQVMVLVLGMRNRKRWEFEAKFRDMSEREFGKFDIELSRNEQEESGFFFKASFRLRHESLEKGQTVAVYLDDALVMRGDVQKAGRIYLRDKAVLKPVSDPREGQVCRVVWGGIEQFRAPLRPD